MNLRGNSLDTKNRTLLKWSIQLYALNMYVIMYDQQQLQHNIKGYVKTLNTSYNKNTHQEKILLVFITMTMVFDGHDSHTCMFVFEEFCSWRVFFRSYIFPFLVAVIVYICMCLFYTVFVSFSDSLNLNYSNHKSNQIFILWFSLSHSISLPLPWPFTLSYFFLFFSIHLFFHQFCFPPPTSISPIISPMT